MRFKTKLTIFGVLASLGVWLMPGTSFAGTGQIYLAPSSASVQNGSNITLALRINPGTSVNAVQATVGYNSSQLQFVSTSLGVFSTCAQNSGGGGSVTLGCAILGSDTSSDSLIANITFTALAGSGSDSLGISNANAAENGTYTNPSTAGATVSFTTPATSGGGSGGSSSSGSSSSKTTKKTATTTTTTAAPTPTATPVVKPTLTTKQSDVQFSQASIGVASSIPVQVALQYGTSSADLGSTTAFSPLGTAATVSLAPGQLVPGTTYYYMIVAKDAAGNVTDSTIKSLTTKGFTLQVTVLDGAYHPIIGQNVSLHSTPMTAKTNSNGMVTFTNVAPGVHHVEYSLGSKTYSQAVYVDDNIVTKAAIQTAAPQQAAVIFVSYKAPKIDLGPVILLLAILAAVVIGGTVFMLHENPLSGQVKTKFTAGKSLLSSSLTAVVVKPAPPTPDQSATNKAEPPTDKSDDPKAKT